MTQAIYPIYLPDRTAMELVQRHAWQEFDKHKRYHSSRNVYEYTAKVAEGGDVELRVRYSFDDGFCMGSGTAFTKTVRPYGDAELLAIKRNRMMHLAAVAYAQSEEQKRLKAVLAQARKMFPGEEL